MRNQLQLTTKTAWEGHDTQSAKGKWKHLEINLFKLTELGSSGAQTQIQASLTPNLDD